MLRKLNPVLDRLFSGRFARRLATLSGGTALAQLLMVLSAPLLTRLFTPEEFGVLVVFSTVGGLMAVIVTLRLDHAIPIARDDRDAAHLAAFCVLITPVISVALVLALWLGADRLASMTQTAPIVAIMPLLLLVYVGNGLVFVFSFLSIRRGTFAINAVSRIVLAAAQVLIQLGAGLIGAGGVGLVLGYSLGYMAQLAYLFWASHREDRRAMRAIDAGHLKKLVIEYWRFPAFTMPSVFLKSAAQLLPALFIAFLYGPVMAGLFGLSQRIAVLPVRLISQAASQVFLAEIAGLPPAKIYGLLKRTTLRFFLVGLIGMLPFLLAGPSLFALVFGEPWRLAGSIVQVLVPLQLARFVMMPISQTMNVIRRQEIDFIAALLMMAVLIGSFVVGHGLGLSALATILLYSIGGSLVQSGYFLVLIRIVRQQARAPTPDSA